MHPSPPPETDTAADGTHPSGMHSYIFICLLKTISLHFGSKEYCAPPQKKCPFISAIVFHQWRIQDFPEVGAPTLRGGAPTYDFANFSQKCMKLKEFGPPWGGTKFYHVDPPLFMISPLYENANIFGLVVPFRIKKTTIFEK